MPASRVTLGLMRPSPSVGVLPRNDPRQYDELAGEWWRPGGAFAMLHWLAAARAALVPPATGAGAVLVDLGCGAGLLAPHLAGRATGTSASTWSRSALAQAADARRRAGAAATWPRCRWPTAAPTWWSPARSSST